MKKYMMGFMLFLISTIHGFEAYDGFELYHITEENGYTYGYTDIIDEDDYYEEYVRYYDKWGMPTAYTMYRVETMGDGGIYKWWIENATFYEESWEYEWEETTFGNKVETEIEYTEITEDYSWDYYYKKIVDSDRGNLTEETEEYYRNDDEGTYKEYDYEVSSNAQQISKLSEAYEEIDGNVKDIYNKMTIWRNETNHSYTLKIDSPSTEEYSIYSYEKKNDRGKPYIEASTAYYDANWNLIRVVKE